MFHHLSVNNCDCGAAEKDTQIMPDSIHGRHESKEIRVAVIPNKQFCLQSSQELSILLSTQHLNLIIAAASVLCRIAH